jgi:hypothetical protein
MRALGEKVASANTRSLILDHADIWERKLKLNGMRHA